MRSKTVVRSKSWKHLVDPSTSKPSGEGGAEVKGKKNSKKKPKQPKNHVNVDDEEDDEYNGSSNNYSDGNSEEESCTPSEFMKMMMGFMKSKSRKRKRPKSERQKVLSEGAVLKSHHENVGRHDVAAVPQHCM